MIIRRGGHRDCRSFRFSTREVCNLSSILFYGEAAGDEHGWSVSLSLYSSKVANGYNSERGDVHVYQFSGGTC